MTQNMNNYAEIEPFLALIQEKTGIIFGQYQYGALSRLLKKRMQSLALRTVAAYVAFLGCAHADSEWQSLIHEITIKETAWYRNKKDFEVLADIILPRLLRKSKTVRIASAGCATGEEVYSLLIHLRESPLWQPDIRLCLLAADLDAQALEVARKGVYAADKLRLLAKEIQARYFLPAGNGQLQVKAEYRAQVTFLPHNLKGSSLPAQQGLWDVIFCRNVLIYFSPQDKSRVLSELSSVLAGDGYLFLGYSESITSGNDAFATVQLGGIYCYQKRTPAPDNERRHEQKRISLLLPGITPETTCYQAALDLIRSDRQAAAEQLLSQIAGKHDRIGYLLTLGNLYFSSGAFVEAWRQYELAAEQDPLCAEAYLLAGIVCYALGHWEVAIGLLKKAVFLAPTWSIAYFYLALVHEQLGLWQSARLHLQQAEQVLLQHNTIGTFRSYTKDIADFLCSPDSLLAVIKRKELAWTANSL